MSVVLTPMRLVAYKPLRCTPTVPKPHFDLPKEERVVSVPQACRDSKVRLQGRLYLVAMPWRISTASASLPSPTRYLGVSLRRITKMRAMDMANTRAPEEYQT